MLQIRIRRGSEQVDPGTDPLGRSEIGYIDGLSEQEVWDRSRGVWKFKADRVLDHAEVQIIDADQIVRAVAAITGVEKLGDRRAVIGDLLIGDPRVGCVTVFETRSQNPISYF